MNPRYTVSDTPEYCTIVPARSSTSSIWLRASYPTERMFDALSAEGINMKMITTGDIKISVLVDEDVPTEEPLSDMSGESIKKAHLESRKAAKEAKQA